MVLTKVFRQNDQSKLIRTKYNCVDIFAAAFVNMLNEMRFGRMQESTIEIFKSLSRKISYTDGIEPTEMYDCHFSLSALLASLIEIHSHPDTRPGRKCLLPTAYDSRGFAPKLLPTKR